MMEEDYVDPAGGKPDVVAVTRDSTARMYERDSKYPRTTATTKKNEKVGETNFQVSLVDSRLEASRVSRTRFCVVLLP